MENDGLVYLRQNRCVVPDQCVHFSPHVVIQYVRAAKIATGPKALNASHANCKLWVMKSGSMLSLQIDIQRINAVKVKEFFFCLLIRTGVYHVPNRTT